IPVLDAAQARMKPGGLVVNPCRCRNSIEPIAGFHTDPRLRRLVRSRSGRANAPRPCQPSRRSRSRLPALLGRTGHWWRPTGAAGGPRPRLPARPAIGSASTVGPLASGPLRACGLEAVFAKRGEVDHEVDAVDYSLLKLVAPVEHGRQSRNALGRNICSAIEVATNQGNGLTKPFPGA